MSTATKLRIDLQQGTLEVEGEEHFVREIYQEFKGRFRSKASPEMDQNGKVAREAPKKYGNPAHPGIVKGLDLSPEGKVSLKELYHSYKRLSRTEKFLLYIVYLQDQLGIEKITADHIHTCMKEVGDRVPATLRQIISNSKNKTGWFRIENGIIRYTRRGKNYFEKELPQKLRRS